MPSSPSTSAVVVVVAWLTALLPMYVFNQPTVKSALSQCKLIIRIGKYMKCTGFGLPRPTALPRTDTIDVHRRIRRCQICATQQ